MIFANDKTTGGDTLFYNDRWCEDAFKVICCNHRLILGPFNRVYHGASPWTGFRACIGAYVDENVLEFFHQFNYDAIEHCFGEVEKKDYFAKIKEFKTLYKMETMNEEGEEKEEEETEEKNRKGKQ